MATVICNRMSAAISEIDMKSDRIVLKPECRTITGLSDRTRLRMERKGDFPSRFSVSPGRCGWLLSELNAWLKQRAESRGEPEKVL